MQMTFGLLTVTLKYTYRRSNTIIYQRAVPSKLADRYSGKTVKHDLKTTDLARAEKAVVALNRRYEAEWAGLLAAPGSSPASLKAHSAALLKTFGLVPGSPHNDADAADVFFDRLKDKRQSFARGDEDVYENADHADYLTPVEHAALKALHGKQLPSLSDALDLHLSIHPQRGNTTFVAYQRRAFDTLIAVTGDKAVADFKRPDARSYLDAALLTVKTTTVRRRLGVMSAVFATYIRENDLTIPNPFASLTIDREGHDRKKRFPFTGAELATLDSACRERDDPMRWILALLAGTGARLAEVVGLPVEDIVLDSEVPHIIIQVHPWRDIKGAKGLRGMKDRVVPLVGPALWAAQRAISQSEAGQRFAFPQYTSTTVCKAPHASGALNSWLRRLPLVHTCHDLRHTVKDQLRAVQCPKDISDAITGHGTKSVSDGYGMGYGLPVKLEWLAKGLARYQ
jgi:integrase